MSRTVQGKWLMGMSQHSALCALRKAEHGRSSVDLWCARGERWRSTLGAGPFDFAQGRLRPQTPLLGDLAPQTPQWGEGVAALSSARLSAPVHGWRHQ
jgi:hypothetical protein